MCVPRFVSLSVHNDYFLALHSPLPPNITTPSYLRNRSASIILPLPIFIRLRIIRAVCLSISPDILPVKNKGGEGDCRLILFCLRKSICPPVPRVWSSNMCTSSLVIACTRFYKPLCRYIRLSVKIFFTYSASMGVFRITATTQMLG